MHVDFKKIEPNKYELHLAVKQAEQTALDLLKKAFTDNGLSLSRQKIKQAMQKGCVWLERNNQQGKPFIQRLRRAKKVIGVGDTLHCYYDEDVLNAQPPEAKLVSDRGDYSIWNKPSGMLSQGSKWGDHCTINRWAERHLQPERPAFIVHRLDRAASGLIILAHKKTRANQFARLFRNHKIEKHYRASVVGDFSTLDLSEKKHKTITESIDGKAALTHITFLNYDKKTHSSLLDVHIKTGRKHQIRKHLSGLGYPIIGDRLYGNVRDDCNLDLQLKSVLLRFICPVSDELVTFALPE